ncbi:SRPBCC family protein [Gordonia sp. (in: high G+C Gram-positive bacteria)]|uniref:SRPBCC family protein n=1 Tax=Gordonia sp. (in: high G+C Gram-positive bacteria) TaxID=84139 RepID=UPI0016B742B6|nr:SRPBCC family protein [Gordonia sp. (in: high G+C Gram-positive bacteria)]NLG45261.1 SRPBCC family protein [Gordonia sp. (in: high G+C Gram-positive bacteria)]
MTRFTLTEDLPCSADVAWTLLTDPARMRLWSSAPVTLADPGVGGRPDTLGTIRRITLPHGRVAFLEIVEASERPHLFRYRVFRAGPLLRHHRGEQQIVALPDGCRVVWTVDVELLAPLLGRLMVGYLRREVRASLGALRRYVLQHGRDLDGVDPGLSPAPDHVPVTADRLQALAAAAHVSLVEQRAIAEELADEDDPKQWFARVYQYVTEEMIDAASDPESPLTLTNRDWVLALIPTFHEYFIDNLDRYRHGLPAEPAWQTAWSMCERTNPDNPALPVMRGLLAGVAAHIEADLPRALARVHRAEFADRDLREFRPDYLRLAPVFSTASDRLLADLPKHYTPWWVVPIRRLHPNFLDAALARSGYDVARHRLRAFAAATELCDDAAL